MELNMYTYVSLDNTPFQHMDVCDMHFMLFWLANANAKIDNVCLSPDIHNSSSSCNSSAYLDLLNHCDYGSQFDANDSSQKVLL